MMDLQETDENVPVVLVLAVSENGVIGRGNALPWDLPDDLQHFKRATMGCPILMGRKTFESVGRPLPGRTNLVLTRDVTWHAPGVTVLTSVDEALARAQAQALIDGSAAICVVGGAEIYRLCLPKADRLLITLVHGNVDGDATFDLSVLRDWKEQSRELFPGGSRNSHDFSVVEFVRCG
ncbi:dihydrofolate reductase [Luminiphilus sp. nBUS_16]|uniref:dihydrofolate reductase n=1 Tax=Luminiphilus sp. nBUS_16 TaxID=3395315 RepID=UPI003EBA0658